MHDEVVSYWSRKHGCSLFAVFRMDERSYCPGELVSMQMRYAHADGRGLASLLLPFCCNLLRLFSLYVLPYYRCPRMQQPCLFHSPLVTKLAIKKLTELHLSVRLTLEHTQILCDGHSFLPFSSQPFSYPSHYVHFE